jgi:hypothetical protein
LLRSAVCPIAVAVVAAAALPEVIVMGEAIRDFSKVVVFVRWLILLYKNYGDYTLTSLRSPHSTPPHCSAIV